uniref:DNA-processing protein DprA n=1 Tax=Tessaracoccus bendigoensis TaxID=72764 RepID=UPI0009321021
MSRRHSPTISPPKRRSRSPAAPTYGIDGAAHSASLASSGHTVAVLAGGLDRPYPVGHRELLERIGDLGLIVSELPPGETPTRRGSGCFPGRGWGRNETADEFEYRFSLQRQGRGQGPCRFLASSLCYRLFSHRHPKPLNPLTNQ